MALEDALKLLEPTNFVELDDLRELVRQIYKDMEEARLF